MIEMVYSGSDPEEQGDVKVPKNIHQIGENPSNKKIYIEDYVMTQLKKKPEKEEDVKYGVLLGEVKRGRGNVYIFVKGMVEVREIIENSLIFNDDIWSGIYNDIKTFFEGMEIVGWYLSVPYRVSDDMSGIRKIHLDNFAGNDKVCFLSDRTEKEEGFYMFEQGSLQKQQGYYIYYEKNEKMKKYVKNAKSNKVSQNQEVQTEKKKKQPAFGENEKIRVVPAGNITDAAGEKTQESSKSAKEPKSFREILRESGEAEPRRQGRVAYGISGLLVIALLLSTVVMLNNYGELKTIKQTLSNLNASQEAKAVNEILGAYTETAVAQTTAGKGAEKNTAQMATKQTAAANPSSKNDLAQGTTQANAQMTSKAAEIKNTTPAENPTAKSAANAYSGTYHTVAPGQTLYDISMKYYGTSKMVEALKALNDIDDNYTIVEGQKILLP